jgi:hypothetical protein
MGDMSEDRNGKMKIQVLGLIIIFIVSFVYLITKWILYVW